MTRALVALAVLVLAADVLFGAAALTSGLETFEKLFVLGAIALANALLVLVVVAQLVRAIGEGRQ